MNKLQSPLPCLMHPAASSIPDLTTVIYICRKDVNRSSVIAKHVHRWFPVTVASQALTGQTMGRYTLWVLGFIEKQVGQRPQCKPLDNGSGGGVNSLRQTPTASPCAAAARSCSHQRANNNQFVLGAIFGLELCSLPNCDFSLSKNN